MNGKTVIVPMLLPRDGLIWSLSGRVLRIIGPALSGMVDDPLGFVDGSLCNMGW